MAEQGGRYRHGTMSMRSMARQIIRRFVRTAVPAFPSGHYYSPVVDLSELRRDQERVFDRTRRLVDIDLREEAQVDLLADLARHFAPLSLMPSRSPDRRYYYDNAMFGFSDAAIYGCLLVHRRPGTVVEIGSGYSSALLLDVRDQFLGGETQCVFIDPNPERLERLLRPDADATATVLRQRVQDVPLSVFDELGPGDILFIDSSHVAKGGSDVCYELFEILPRLAPGVAIHIHDIHYPFEYPEAWFFGQNRSWNEAYLVRALLANSQRYRILLFVDFLHRFHPDLMARCMPGSSIDTGGSLWIEVNGPEQNVTPASAVS